MKLKDLVSQINITVLNDRVLDQEVEIIYIGDLLSMVMRKASENSLWLTVQAHLNAIAVAEMLDLSGIIFVEGVIPDQETIQKANELNLPLLSSQESAYTLAKKFVSLGL